jgi:hypothetical protein
MVINIREGYNTHAIYYGLSYIYSTAIPEFSIELKDVQNRKVHRVEREGKVLYLRTYEIELDEKTVSLNEVSHKEIVSILDDGTCNFDEDVVKVLDENYDYVANTHEIGDFLVELIKQNEFVYSLFTSNAKFKEDVRNLIRSSRHTVIPMIIFKNMIRNSVDTLEKIYKSCGSDFFIKNVCSSELEFQNDRKRLRQIMGLPDNVLEFLKHPTYASLYPEFKELSENRSPNDASLLVKFITMMMDINHKYPSLSRGNYFSFIKAVLEISSLTNTSMKAILNYLYAQSFNYSVNGGCLSVPTTDAITMRDYLAIAKKFNIVVDPLPGNIRSAHYYILNNTSYAEDEEKNKQFVKAINEYRHLEYTGEKYSVVVPKDISDMIDEGTSMHHCIASYVDRVIDNKQIVLFCRDNESLDKSLVSFEVSAELEFVQIKEKYDNDVQDIEILEFLKEWQEIKQAEMNGTEYKSSKGKKNQKGLKKEAV